MVKILKKRFLDRVAKRITSASQEFQIDDAFELMESQMQNPDEQINPLTQESLNFMDSDPDTQDFNLKATSFSAELTIVHQIDLLQNMAGIVPVGTVIIIINSAEIEAKGFTIDRLEHAFGINIKQPIIVNKYGSYTQTRSGFYKVISVTPNYIKDRLIEIEIAVSLFDNNVGN